MVLTDIQKMTIITKYFEEKKSALKISKEMNINKNTVYLWIKRYLHDKNIERKRGTGFKNKHVN